MKIIRLFLFFSFFFCLSKDAFAQSQKPRLEEFVKRQYYHGMPYKIPFDSTDLPRLFEMLHNQDYKEDWGTVISIIGRIKDDSAFKPLLDFIKGETLEEDARYSGGGLVSVTFQAFGYLAQNGNEEIIDYLSKWLNPYYYKEANFKFGKSIDGKDISERLGGAAISALGFSGSPRALNILKSLEFKQNPLRILMDKEWRYSVNNNLQNAIKTNREFQHKGFDVYFGELEAKKNH